MTEPKVYTTAIIAAVPATDDPVHEVVTEDAHVTLQFLGEAADLSEDQVEEIQQTLEMLASVVYPFEVDISGTAELGPDKAQVLIVQSALLTKLRETLGMSEAVSTAVAANDQFPNWIPHLTMAYDGEMPDVSAYESVTIGSIELWLGEDQHSYPLATAKQAVTAAGEKIFEEGLHPRGADGRFIEKFGVIKYLTGLGWQYGKVEGIYADKGTGAIKLTVTPSDLAGKTHGDSVVLSPKQVYRAPSAKAHLTTSAVGVKKIGGQGGSNPGGLYTMPSVKPQGLDDALTNGAATDTYYVKKPKSVSHGQNEALANALYEEAGVPVPEVDLASDGQLYSKIVSGKQDMSSQLDNPEWTDQVRRNFAVDAWLGNRDVFGMTYDNILTDEHGVPWRIDNGGALLYRAMGEKKTDFGSQVTELDAFRTGKKAKIYGPQMSKAQELDGAERVLAISPGQIEDMVSAHNLPKSLADTLKARRLYIADYYGLTLPESQKPAEAEGPTTAPLVDAPDIAANGGKTRNWFKTPMASLAFTAQTGDTVELPDGSNAPVGVGEDGQPLSMVGTQAQLLGWASQFPGSSVFLKKKADTSKPRPEHGSKLLGSDLSQQAWKRGDVLVDANGAPWKVQSWNTDSGALLVSSDSQQLLLDTLGKDKAGIWTVERWDPPAVDTAPPAAPALPVQTEQQAMDIVDDELTSYTATPSGYVPEVISATDVPDHPEQAVVIPVPGKTGQAAEAETKIKADLDQPLPSGNGTPAPSKTTAPGGAKVMVIGDGTEAATGDAVTSKKDGKTYTFVKPKGQYAVVTDPNGEDPSKQLLKLASTMTQPGKAPAAGDVEVEKPKTATGEIPALGMMAEAKDGWVGEITLISPDGKFVFITDANGKRKRKSTGTVSITSGAQPVTEAPKKSPGPLKDYGPAPTSSWKGEEKNTGYWAPDSPQLNSALMVHVSYADGSDGLEPYSGQPIDTLETNSQGKVASYGDLKGYMGPVSSSQFAAASQDKATTYQVIYAGNVFFADGTLGPNGGLVLWYSDDNDGDTPGSDAWETVPGSPVTLTVIGNENAANMPLTLPEGIAFQTADETDGATLPANPPLYGDEAKTLTQWKGQLSEGSEISLDGQNWLSVKGVSPSGSVTAQVGNGQTVFINPWSSATYVVKAPPLVNGDAPSTGLTPGTTEVSASPEIPDFPGPGKKVIADLMHGDVVTDYNNDLQIIDSVDAGDGDSEFVQVKILGEDFGTSAMPDTEMTYHGNLSEEPVTVPVGAVAQHLYPGATLNLGNGGPVQVVSYPELLDNGSYRFAVFSVGQPDMPYLVTVGEWNSGADLSNELAVPVQLGAFTTWQDAGVDINTLNALFDSVKTQPVDTTDHHAQMTDQGVPFGTAGYPIFYGEQSETYFRTGANGQMQEWGTDTGTWNDVYGDVAGKTKVWDGVPFEGELKLPAGLSNDALGGSPTSDVLAAYKPTPGTTVAVATFNVGGPKTVVVAYPQGLNGPAHSVLLKDGKLEVSTETFASGWEKALQSSPVVAHDPFAETAAPAVTHHEGPQPPAALGAKLQQVGFTPEPGAQLFYAQIKIGTANPTFLKGEDGKYRRLSPNGGVGTAAYTLDELTASSFFGDGDWDFFTYTYLPEGADTPATVGGLPEGFAPYVPGKGESVLKVTLPNGKQNVYLQKQPGAGWYEMGPDGTVNESSDAVKSDYVVTQKLATGSSGSAAKYQLLHPLPEGVKPEGKPVPEFSNDQGSWTPEPGQKVVSLISYPGDTDPWFMVQDEPGKDWFASPINSKAMTLTDSAMQVAISKKATPGGAAYTLVYDGHGDSAVDTPEKALASFSGYTPKEGEQVLEEPNGSHWVFTPGDSQYHPVKDDGTIDTGYGLTQAQLDADNYSANLTKVWPAQTDATEAAPATPNFGGYTPAEGDKVVSADLFGKQTFLVQQSGESDYKLVKADGTINPHGGATAHDIESGALVNTQVWPATEGGPGGVFAGYQAQASENVAQFTSANGNLITVVQQPNGTWAPVVNGQLEPDDAYSQATIDWASDPVNGLNLSVLQGAVKGAPAAEPDALDTTTETYAGVSEVTSVGKATFGTYTPSATQQDKLSGLSALEIGQSIYVLEDASLPGGSTAVLIRHSDGSWSSVGNNGYLSSFSDDDEGVEQFVTSGGYVMHKGTFGAPTAAPAAPVQNAYAGPPISGWAAVGAPDPASFGYASSEDVVGMQAGSWLYIQSGTGGLFVQLAEDAKPGGNVMIKGYIPVKNGTAGEMKTPSTGKPIMLPLGTADHIYAQNFNGTQAAPGTAAPAAAPSAPQAPVSSAPAVPVYPGAQKPSQEDINAWGGSLTKDGHIPTPGMFVTGKGPMSGKVISVSKDKTKAVVLTGDGKKTTRLIEALKTDPSANYSAYAAPVTLKDVPSGMPLAVDTLAEALDKTAKDGKFRAILSGHPGVSQGQMVVTKTTAPSGKVFNRVHLTLTPAQREQLLSSLAGTGEKGDWVKSSKQSEAVAIGDQLPMRKSSTDNPDGTPRWKVDPETNPPTHTVSKVEDEAGGAGIKIVTLTNNTTGEVITSRFHAGKSLTTYAWDPNKAKPVTSNSFSLSDVAKAQGWQHVTDGGISAITGGASNGKLYNEPGSPVTKSALGQVSHSWKTLRNVSADGVVIETVDPKGSNGTSTTGVTVISVPEGVDEKALNAALAKMGIDYRPMTQDDAKSAVRGVLRTMLSLDTSDVDTPKHFTDEMLFSQAGKTMGISDLGWQDVLMGVDESTGKTSFFWSDRARNALAAKASYNLVYRAASTASATQIVSTVKYGSASSILKKTTGMLDGSSSVGNGASASSDNSNHAGHGSYASASSVNKLPSANSLAGYKHAGMMVYHRPEAVLGRIMDYRVANSDAFGMGQGQGADHLKAATTMSSVRDYFLGGGLPTEAVGFIAVDSVANRDAAIAQLKADGFSMINGRPVEDIVITKQKAATMSPSDLPPVTLPANARPILDLPVSYDAPAVPTGAASTGGEAAA